jgi:PST family polysaccharide transporter
VAVSQSLANYVLPLVTIPYITRIVGPSNYGKIEWITTVMLYFIVVVDYSFDSTAARRLAALRVDDHRRISRLFSAVMGAKAVLLGAVTLIFGLLIAFFDSFQSMALWLTMAFPIVLGWVLFPQFLFVGLQKLGISAVANLLIKVLAAASFFIFLKSPDQFYLVPAINGIAQLLSGIVLFFFSFQLIRGLQFRWPPRRSVVMMIREGGFIFLSNLFNRIQAMNVILIGGFMLISIELGYLAAAFKLILVAQSFLFFPLYGALFPYLSAKVSKDPSDYLFHLKRIRNLLLLASVVSALVLYFASDLLVNIIFGSDYGQSVTLLQILAPSLIASAVLHIYHFQGLQVLRQDDAYFKVVFVGGIVSLSLNILLMMGYGITGAAWSKLILEVLMAAYAFILFQKRLKKLNYA